MSEETKEPLEETPVTAETAETEQEKTPENQEPEKKAKKKEKKEKGIIYKKRGLGMFVSTGAESKIRSERKQEFFDKYIRALVSEAEKLKISRDEIITMIEKGCDNNEHH